MKLKKLLSFEHPLSPLVFVGAIYFSIIGLGAIKKYTYKPTTEIIEIYRIKQSEQIEVLEDTSLRFHGLFGRPEKIYHAKIETRENYSQPRIINYKKGEERPKIPKNAELIRKFEKTHKTYFEWVNRHNPMINFLSALKKDMKKVDSVK